MLENTAQTETKVPNSLAIVAAQAVVEQAKKYHEQVRETVERQRASERAHEASKASREEAVKVSVGDSSSDAPISSSSTSDAGAVPLPSRGTAVDLNA